MSESLLLIVQINPEMRVKLERGPALAQLIAGKSTRYLLRVENEARTTATLHLQTQQLTPRDRWLKLALGGKGKLTGARVQTLSLTLTPTTAGVREARFLADIGQGTQDLGFRAELAVLFRCQ